MDVASAIGGCDNASQIAATATVPTVVQENNANSTRRNRSLINPTIP
jgi:hypothetical protein